MSSVRLTMLNAMAAQDFIQALDRHVAWGLTDVDLKDGIFGKYVLDLNEAEARRAAEELAERKLSVHCLSTGLLFKMVEEGERAFRKAYVPQLDAAIRTARHLRAHSVRLLSARTVRHNELTDAIAYTRAEHPWLMPLYREFVDRLHDAGLTACIENEVGGNIFSSPGEIVEFFEELDRPGKAIFTWDLVNLWQEGAFPSAAVYRQLKPFIGYLHVKGGRSEVPGGPLHWASTLAEASWPAKELLTQIVRDGVAPVICLNPPHGVVREELCGTDVTAQDVAFVKAVIAEAQ